MKPQSTAALSRTYQDTSHDWHMNSTAIDTINSLDDLSHAVPDHSVYRSEAVFTVFLDDDASNHSLFRRWLITVSQLPFASRWWKPQADPVEAVIWPHFTKTSGASVRREYSVTSD